MKKMKKSFLKNTVFNVGYKVLNVFFPLISAVYVSRILGPGGAGRVAYAQNILSYFLIFASVGIPTYGIKEIARNSVDKKGYSKSFTELFIINSVTTTICIAIYVALVLLVPSFYADNSVYFAVGISLFLNYLNIDWFYAGIEEYVYITVRSTLIKIIAIVGLFVFVRTRDDVVNYALVSAIGLSANYLLNILHARKKVVFNFQGLDIKRHIKPVSILLITMVATDLYNQIDVTMMGSICSKEEIGYYTYAIKLIRMVTSIAAAISATMLPRLSQFFSEEKKADFQNLSNKVLSAVILLIIPCVAGVILCSNNIILVLYGEEFIGAIPLIRILSPIILIIAISYLCGSIVLTAINKEKYLLYATLAGACVNIVLNALLIPKYHGNGAAVASVIAELTVFLFHFIFSKRYINYHFFTIDTLKVVVAALVMIGAVLIVNKTINNLIINLIVSVVMGVIVYFLMLFIFRHKLVVEGVNTLMRKFRR